MLFAPSSVLAPSSTGQEPLVASLFLVPMLFAPSSLLLLVVRPGAPVASLFLVAMLFAPSSFLLLVVRPGAPSSVLVPSTDALCS